METKQTMRKPEDKCVKERYVSCVKINGVPILPPLITPEKCAAIKYYRKQAMKIEKQIIERKKARAIRQPQYYIPPSANVHTLDQTKFTENILDCCRNIESFLSTTYNIDGTDADDQKHTPKLTCDIQASQYINNELVLFDSQSNGTIKSSTNQNVDIEMCHSNGSNKLSTVSSFSNNDVNESFDKPRSDIKKLELQSRTEGFQRPWLNEIKMLELQSLSANASLSKNESHMNEKIALGILDLTTDINCSRNDSFQIRKPDLQSSSPCMKKPSLDKIKKLDSQQNTITNLNVSKKVDMEESINAPRINEIKKLEHTLEKPQLIRSNSYILETPSPVLIEHLKKTKSTNITPRSWSSSDNLYTSNSKIMPNTECDDKSLNQTMVESLKSFAEHGKLPDANLDITKSDSVTNFDTSCTETELKNISDNDSQSYISDSEYKLKQFIDNNVPKNGGDKDIMDALGKCNNETIIINNENDTSKNEVPCKSFDSLKEILKNIPEKYSKQIWEYLDKHKNKSDSEENDNAKFEDFGFPQEFSTPNEDRDKSIIPTTPNQTVYYSVDDDDSKISDYLHKASQELQVSRELQYTSLVIYKTDKNVPTNNADVNTDDNYIRYEKAASIIGAAAKGYLTRRLLHTEKVQNLIDVIKEVLVCAVQLHSENLDCIDEYDVELHRRLIQQVSAACYAFHDIFFNTSIPEQMSIIAMDRQKKIEKLRRPLSNLSVHSAKSTPRTSTSFI